MPGDLHSKAQSYIEAVPGIKFFHSLLNSGLQRAGPLLLYFGSAMHRPMLDSTVQLCSNLLEQHNNEQRIPFMQRRKQKRKSLGSFTMGGTDRSKNVCRLLPMFCVCD